MTNCEDVKPSRLLFVNSAEDVPQDWNGSASTLNTSNRFSAQLDYDTDFSSIRANTAINRNSAEFDTLSSSSARSPRFPRIDTTSEYYRQQQLSPAFQRLSPRSKQLFKSHDFTFPSLHSNTDNGLDSTEFRQGKSQQKNYSTLELSASERNDDKLQASMKDPDLPVSTKSPAKSTSAGIGHDSTNFAPRELKDTANEWASTSIVLGEEDLYSSDEEAISRKSADTKESLEPKARYGSETSSDISFGQSARSFARKTKPNDQRHFPDLLPLAAAPLPSLDGNRNRISTQRGDAASTIVSTTRKAQELEALKKKNKVTSMCKNFENIFGGTAEAPTASLRNTATILDSTFQAPTHDTLGTPTQLTAVAECDSSSHIENISDSSPSDEERNQVAISHSAPQPAIRTVTNQPDLEYRHQTVVDNIIVTSVSPIQAAGNIADETAAKESEPGTMKCRKNTVFPVNNNVTMCVTKDDTNNNDKVPDNIDSNKPAEKNDGIPLLKLRGFVGFDSLPYQLVKKCHNDGFQFNLLCVGETGMGKTTLIESLFNRKMDFDPCNSELKTVELRTKSCEVEESGVRVKLRVVETAGFGDQLDKEKSAKVIVDYINDQFEAYLREELKIKRFLSTYDDTRIHACLYFISPTGHGLKALDVVTMRELSKRVNVIPVIAKADTACKDELIRFKQKIMSELKANNIETYQFPVDDEAVRNENAALNALLPFAVVGSCDFVTKEDGRLIRARNYVWGRVEVENEEHCDFVKLREALLRINEDSLRERTHTVLYEAYRRQRLQEMQMGDGDAGPRIMEVTLRRKKEFDAEVKRRDEQFKLEFEARVQRKEADLKHREDGLNIRQRTLEENFHKEMQNLDNEIARLNAEHARLLTVGKKQRK